MNWFYGTSVVFALLLAFDLTATLRDLLAEIRAQNRSYGIAATKEDEKK